MFVNYHQNERGKNFKARGKWTNKYLQVQNLRTEEIQDQYEDEIEYPNLELKALITLFKNMKTKI